MPLSFNTLKKAVDICLVIIAAVFALWWLIPLVIFFIKLDTPGPVFFVSLRTGAGERRFKCFKFRTLHASYGEQDSSGHYREVTINDTNITTIGRFLRQIGLDELPQILNIVRSEMSWVGPRPHPVLMEEELAIKVPHYYDRFKVKPGLTGLAQICGYRGEANNPEAMRKRTEMDLAYIEHYTPLLDAQILITTVGQIGKILIQNLRFKK